MAAGDCKQSLKPIKIYHKAFGYTPKENLHPETHSPVNGCLRTYVKYLSIWIFQSVQASIYYNRILVSPCASLVFEWRETSVVVKYKQLGCAVTSNWCSHGHAWQQCDQASNHPTKGRSLCTSLVIRAEPSQFVFCCTVSPVFVIIPAVFGNISEACGQRTPRAGFLNHDFAICQTPSVFP